MTMIKNVRDRIVNLFVPEVRAGACVPSNGEICYCHRYNAAVWRYFVHNCTGRCVATSIDCS